MTIPTSETTNTAEVLTWTKAQKFTDAKVYRVGDWVWIEFPGKPDELTRQSLKDAGYHWNQKRLVWQHACGNHSRYGKTDPRLTYEVEGV